MPVILLDPLWMLVVLQWTETEVEILIQLLCKVTVLSIEDKSLRRNTLHGHCRLRSPVKLPTYPLRFMKCRISGML